MKKPSVRKSRPRGEWWWWWGGSWAFLPIITPSRELSPTMRASAGNKECFNSGPPPPKSCARAKMRPRSGARFSRPVSFRGIPVARRSGSHWLRSPFSAFPVLRMRSSAIWMESPKSTWKRKSEAVSPMRRKVAIPLETPQHYWVTRAHPSCVPVAEKGIPLTIIADWRVPF